MKSVLLIGLGRFGKHVAMKLNELGHEVMAVDTNEKRVEEVMPYVTDSLIGDSTDPAFLEKLGVDNYDVCICCIANNFQSSLETASLLKEFGAKKVISRAARDVQEKFLLRNGADEVVYPERQLGTWTAVRHTANHLLDYIELDEEHSIVEVSIPESWLGKSIIEIDIRKKYNINILAVIENDKLNASVNANTVFLENQSLLVLGKYKDLQKCFKF